MNNLKRLNKFVTAVLLGATIFFGTMASSDARQAIFFKGTDYELHVYDIKGKEKGPTVLIIGGIQGDEPGGYLSADSYADISLKKGRLIIVPRANLPSIIMNRRGVNADMNRKFKSKSQRIYEEKVVAILKKLIRQSDVLLNLHDGSGFYRPVWINMWKNPMRFGQSIIADAETYYSKKYHKTLFLGKTARKVAAEVNKKIRNLEYHFHFNNHNTVSPNTRHKEQRKSATYYALTQCGIPAYGIETSKFLPSTHLKVLYHNMVVNEFLKEYGVIMENPKVYMVPPRLEYLVVAINKSQPIVVYDRQSLTLRPGDLICVKGYKANYDRGITVDLVGYGSKNDFGKSFNIRKGTSILVRKDRRIFAKINIKTTQSINGSPLLSAKKCELTQTHSPYLLVKINGTLKVATTDKPLEVIEGDKIELIDVISPSGRLPLKLNFLGFVGNWKNNTGEDRGYLIDTSKDLIKRYSYLKKGNLYTIKASNGHDVFYSFKIFVRRPKLREMLLFVNGRWQSFGDGEACTLRQEASNLKIGVIQTTPNNLDQLAVEIFGQHYTIPETLSCGNAIKILLKEAIIPQDRPLTIKVLRGRMVIGSIYLSRPMKSGLSAHP